MENVTDGVAKSIRPRGFAAMSAEQRSVIASMGGKAAHEKGTAHQFSTEEAIAAGKLRGKLAKEKLTVLPST